MQKILEKLLKLRKNCNHKRNINRIYNKKLHYNYPQQLPTLKLKTYPTAFSPPGGAKCPHKKKKDLRNSDERKWKAEHRASYRVLPRKIQFCSYLVKNSQKATLNFYFKSTFSVKPSKFQIYFAKDCNPQSLSRYIQQSTEAATGGVL